MAIVFIEEVGAPIRVCSKQVTAEKLGIEWADIDLSELTHPTEHYTLVAGALVELTDVITEAAVEAADQHVVDEMLACRDALAEIEDGDPRSGGGDLNAKRGQWQAYRRELRAYVTVVNDVRTISTPKPDRPA